MITEKEVINNSINYKDNHVLFITKGMSGLSLYVLNEYKRISFIDNEPPNIDTAYNTIDSGFTDNAYTTEEWFMDFADETILSIEELLMSQVK